MAKTLLNQMTAEWESEGYRDEYAAAVAKLIEGKIKDGGKEITGKKQGPATATNVIDLAQVLQASLAAAGKAKPSIDGKKKRATQHTRSA